MGIHAEKFLNQQVAVLCARWQYRGVLLGIYNNHLILNPAMGVVSSGISEGEEPEEEHTIANGVMIKKDAVGKECKMFHGYSPAISGSQVDCDRGTL